MSSMVFRLPDVGEGLTEAEIVRWHVAVGDTVVVNQVLVDIETAKAVVELPCPVDGVVAEILASAGQVVPVGTALVDFTPSPVLDVREPSAAAGPERHAVLVGYGVREGNAPVRRRRRAAPAALDPPRGASTVLAKPPVRKLARDLGVELATVGPTGVDGVVSRADVERAARVGSGERRLPASAHTRAMAEAMVRSAFTAPHATEWLEVDVTRGMAMVRRLREKPEFAESRVSPLLLGAAGLLRAVSRHPGVNASWDDATQAVVLKNDVNLGIATATPRGLLVPNIKQAQSLSLVELAIALHEAVATARAGLSASAALTGGTVTITNVGSLGLDGGTPILNPGEALILCLGRVNEKPWVHKGKIRVRKVMQLTASFDHRLVDGALAGQVLTDVADFLQDPALALALP